MYSRTYYQAHKQEIVTRAVIWAKNNPEKLKAGRRKRRGDAYQYHMAYHRALREAVETYLGGKCVRCGYVGSALQLNHKNGGGNREVKRNGGATLYRQILAGARPDIELTCANCNWEHRIENGFTGGHKG